MPQLTNAQYAKDNVMLKNACEKAGIPITTRQASKFQRGIGLAYKVAIKQVEVLLDNGKFVKIVKQ